MTSGGREALAVLWVSQEVCQAYIFTPFPSGQSTRRGHGKTHAPIRQGIRVLACMRGAKLRYPVI